MVVAPHGYPLPHEAGQQQRREDEVDEVVGDEHDAERDDHEADEDKRRIDAEGIFYLPAVEPDEQRDEDDPQQPGILHEQRAGHEDEVLVAEDNLRQSEHEGKRDDRRCEDDARAFLHEPLAAPPVGKEEAQQHVVQGCAEEGVGEDDGIEDKDDAAVPLRFHALEGLILLADDARRAPELAPQVGEDSGITAASVLEDAGLYLLIAFVGVVVEGAQMILRVPVDVDVVSQLLVVLLQRAADAHGECQADVPVGARRRAQRVLVHLVEVHDEAVVTGNLAVGAVDERAEGQYVLLEPRVLLSGLVTGVGQVEDVFRLLRVEHQRVLVAAVHDVHQLVEHLLLLLLHESRLAVEFPVVVHQLSPQDGQRAREVGLLQHRVAARAPQPQHRPHGQQPSRHSPFSTFHVPKTILPAKLHKIL